LAIRWQEEYQKARPGVAIDVQAGGAGKGIADALAGVVDIGMVSREINPAELAKGAFPLAVAKDAVVVTLSRKNPFLDEILRRGLRKEDLAAVWIGRTVKTWEELLGRTGRTPLRVFTRSDACGAAETWAAYLGGHQEDLGGVGVYGDPGLAEAVKSDALGLGFNNLGFAYDGATGLPFEGLVPVPIDKDEDGRVGPAEDVSTRAKAQAAIQSGAYPAPPARPLHLVAKGSFGGPARDFVRWLLGDGQAFVEAAGYVRLAPPEVARALAALEGQEHRAP
jgi:phosphate transport system substrate-binding protein